LSDWNSVFLVGGGVPCWIEHGEKEMDAPKLFQQLRECDFSSDQTVIDGFFFFALSEWCSRKGVFATKT